MAAIGLHIHPQANIRWGKLEEIAGNIVTFHSTAPGTPENGQPPEPIEPHALAMTDPDGEVHVYVFTDEGKQALLSALTGGVIVP